MADWELVEDYLQDARAIAWDTCHKIYVLMDDEYDPLITWEEMSDEEMLATIQDWYEQSCGLRFVEAVRTNPKNPNEGFITLVAQGEDDEEEED